MGADGIKTVRRTALLRQQRILALVRKLDMKLRLLSTFRVRAKTDTIGTPRFRPAASLHVGVGMTVHRIEATRLRARARL